jgi:hypothetical protein
MRITSKSIHHSNIVYVFDESRFSPPENHLLTSFYRGDAGAGSRFIDDPALRTKVLDLPKLKLQISVEPGRLRVDDTSQAEPGQSFLIQQADKLYRELFSRNRLIGFGFNFDIYYQTDRVIRQGDIFANFAGKAVTERSELLDLGVQFTLEKEGGQRRETYFVKITAPMEVAVHANYHFPIMKMSGALGMPESEDVEASFEDYYRKTDDLIRELRF